MKKTIIASAVLSVISFGAMAENPSFDNVEIGYTEFDFDGADIDGFELKGSKLISDDFYIKGDIASLSESSLDWRLTKVGVGYKNDFSSSSSFFSEVSYARVDVDSDFGDADEDGYEVALGIRSMLSDKLEAKAAVEYTDIDGDDITSLVVGGAYNFTSKMSVYADYSYDSDLSAYGVGIRFNF
jgi:predicted porin